MCVCVMTASSSRFRGVCALEENLDRVLNEIDSEQQVMETGRVEQK